MRRWDRRATRRQGNSASSEPRASRYPPESNRPLSRRSRYHSGIMTITVTKPKAGLEDTVATSSAICYLDGERGVLAYCGYDIHDLARHATFEEVCYLLWHRRLPTRAELGDLQSALVAARPLRSEEHTSELQSLAYL